MLSLDQRSVPEFQSGEKRQIVDRFQTEFYWASTPLLLAAAVNLSGAVPLSLDIRLADRGNQGRPDLWLRAVVAQNRCNSNGYLSRLRCRAHARPFVLPDRRRRTHSLLVLFSFACFSSSSCTSSIDSNLSEELIGILSGLRRCCLVDRYGSGGPAVVAFTWRCSLAFANKQDRSR